MTETVPDRILVRVDYDGDVDGQWINADAPRPHSFGHYFTEYVPATALEAAQARIQALEDTLNIERALSDGAHRRAKTARREALEEAVKFILDQPTSDGVVDMAAEELAAAIRALMEGKR